MDSENDHDCLTPDELLKETQLNVKKYGLQVIMVESSPYLPSFAYSIGLWQNFKHPEIICFGLPTNFGHTLINDVAAVIKNGEAIDLNKIYHNFFNNGKAAFIAVNPNNIKDYFRAAINYYDADNFPALQLVWTDRNDRFPWEEGFEDIFAYKQPLLDRNMGFKFREPQSLTTFTTRQWLELDAPITLVIHEHDGDWQFLTGDQEPEDIRIVALKELVSRDNTLNELFDLDYGEEAERNAIGDKWIRTKFEEYDD